MIKLKQKAPACNRYVCTRLFQGIILSLTTYLHICFASVLIHGVIAGVYSEQNQILAFVLLVLAICAVIAVISGNYRRYTYFREQRELDPKIHYLMPMAHRNVQISQILNLQAASVMLNTSSLSEHFYTPRE